MDEDEQRRLLDFLDQPTFIIEAGGIVRQANRSSRNLLGCDPAGRSLEDFTDCPPGDVRHYLSRCSGSGSTVIGSLVLKSADGDTVKAQAAGARLSARGQTPPLVALRLSPDRVKEFSILARHVENLNLEVRKRRRVQQELERSLDLKNMLLHELHHRVKNHMQMLLAMLSLARRGTAEAGIQSFLDTMGSRLRALAAAQDLMYDAERLSTVPGKAFLDRLVTTISTAWPHGATISVRAADVQFRNDVAFPLALIVNELLTNALKHGLRFGPGRVAIELTESEDKLLLAVRDNGPGLAPAGEMKRSFGMTLVRGLCEQIGGSLEISRGEEACFTVRFPRS